MTHDVDGSPFRNRSSSIGPALLHLRYFQQYLKINLTRADWTIGWYLAV
jgi:hypothetical protein